MKLERFVIYWLIAVWMGILQVPPAFFLLFMSAVALREVISDEK